MNSTTVQQAVLDGHAQSRLAPIPVTIGLPKPSGDSATQQAAATGRRRRRGPLATG